MSETIVTVARAYGQNCVGAKRHKRPIMLSFTGEGSNAEIEDYFLSTEQAEALVRELNMRLAANKLEDEKVPALEVED